MWQTIKLKFGLSSRNLGAIIGFEFTYKFLTAGLFTPLFIVLLQRSILQIGLGNSSQADITHYLTRPSTIAVLAAILLCMILVTLVDIFAVIQAHQASFRRQRISVGQMFASGLSGVHRVLKPANWGLMAYSLLFWPWLTAIPLTLFLLCVRLPMNVKVVLGYYWKPAAVGIGVALVLFVVLLSRVFILHSFCLQEKGAGRAWRESRQQVKHRYFSILFEILIWELFLGAVAALLAGASLGIAVPVVRALRPAVTAFDASLYVVTIIGIIIAAIFHMFFVPMFFANVSALYFRTAPEEEVPAGVKQRCPAKTLRPAGQKILALLICMVVLVDGSGFIVTWELDQTVNGTAVAWPQVTAHRGASTVAPENTLPAFQKAIDMGADWVEMDVQQTSDGVIILNHDPSLKRVTGLAKEAWQVDYATVASLDAGSWFSKEYAGVHVPTLEDVVKECKGNVKMNIELKPSGHEKDFEKNVLAVLDKYDMKDECVIACLKVAPLKTVRKLDGRYKTLYIADSLQDSIINDDDIDMMSVETNVMDTSVVNKIHKAGKQVFVWTVNNEEKVSEMVDDGADNIISDNLQSTRDVIEREKVPGITVEVVRKYYDKLAAQG